MSQLNMHEKERMGPKHRWVMLVINPLYMIWKKLFSPLFRGSCRFYPFCSDYAREAFEQHGAFKGAGLTVYRLCRCHPWCEGGFDPVPQAQERARKPRSEAH